MRVLPIFVMAAAELACSGAFPAQAEIWRRDGNRVFFPVSEGRAELEWLTASAFRFVRDWSGSPAESGPASTDAVDFEVSGDGSVLLLKSRHLSVRIQGKNLRMGVDDAEGRPLLGELSTLRRDRSGSTVKYAAPTNEMFFGLGAANLSETLDLRGQTISTFRPFLISSAGYGLYIATPPRAEFDLAKTDPAVVQITLEGGRLDLYFYYGPAPKEILEQHHGVSPPAAGWNRGELGVLTRAALPRYAVSPGEGGTATDAGVRSAMLGMLHAAFSAQPAPVFDLERFERAPPDVWRHARQLAVFAPLVAGGERDRARLAAERRRLRPFLEAYFQEMFDRGFPIIRPLAMQYPKDPEAVRRADQFLFGDELLVAPALTPAARRNVYLPMGTWTDLRTNVAYPGRRQLDVEPAGRSVVFAKNGALVPFLRPDDVIEAHYFPRSGGEFFIYEPEVGDYTQLHAAPAGDLYRLEIESKVTRRYEWVVHHMKPVRAVLRGGTPLLRAPGMAEFRDQSWVYDQSTGNLHLRILVTAGSGIVCNVLFQEVEPQGEAFPPGRVWCRGAPVAPKAGSGPEIGQPPFDFTCIPAASVLQ